LTLPSAAGSKIKCFALLRQGSAARPHSTHDLHREQRETVRQGDLPCPFAAYAVVNVLPLVPGWGTLQEITCPELHREYSSGGVRKYAGG